MRRLLLLGCAAALAVGASTTATVTITAAPSLATTQGGGCELTGTASLSPGLSATPATQSYTFTGKLTNCHSADATVKSGKVSAKGSGTASCAGGTTNGHATITWNNGKSTSVSFTTVGVANTDQIEGTVTSSTESAMAKGDKAGGSVAFTSFTGSCTTAVTAANFSGAIAAG
jgi:hypothetical protein